MNNLLSSINKITAEMNDLPFSVYTSIHEQKLLNVPVAKPLLITVMSGNKALGEHNDITCQSGQFVFLSDSPAINMRNIPKDKPYLALLIEFDYEHFNAISKSDEQQSNYLIGEVESALEDCLQQFVECAAWAPETITSSRKEEILKLLYHLGYTNLSSLTGKQKISHQLHDLFHENGFPNVTTEVICERLAMSESTLRRKLKAEGTSVQDIKDRARLGLGLHLLQTTSQPIGLIAEQCGYQSQSRFTDRFKNHFGLTPTELRKTKMME